MTSAHFILQGRGGVGKTVVASFLAQYAISKGRVPVCIDTDPVNATLAGYRQLDVRRLDILDDDDINPRHFDQLVDMIATTDAQAVIIDNGASSFVPLTHFLINNQVPALLASLGHRLVIHSVIAGAQSLVDTVNGFAQVVRQFPSEAAFVVWLNPFFGPLEHDGMSFEQSRTYLGNKDRVAAIIHLPVLKKETFGRDLADLLQARMTFDEALRRPDLTIMTRQRLTVIRDRVFAQLDTAAVI